MVFSGEDIIRSVNNKEILISPFDRSLLRPSSYCCTLGGEIYCFEGDGETIDLLDSSSYPSLKTISIKDKPYVLPPSGFILAETKETFGLGCKVTGHISNISGLARVGLSVALSTHVASGFGAVTPRPLALEIKNISMFHIGLVAGVRICHLVFLKNLSESSCGYDEMFPDKYQQGVGSEFYKY